MLVPLISIAIFILGYFIGRVTQFYISFYNYFLESYDEISRYKSMYHPECFDENDNLIEEDFLYVNFNNEEE